MTQNVPQFPADCCSQTFKDIIEKLQENPPTPLEKEINHIYGSIKSHMYEIDSDRDTCVTFYFQEKDLTIEERKYILDEISKRFPSLSYHKGSDYHKIINVTDKDVAMNRQYFIMVVE